MQRLDGGQLGHYDLPGCEYVYFMAFVWGLMIFTSVPDQSLPLIYFEKKRKRKQRKDGQTLCLYQVCMSQIYIYNQGIYTMHMHLFLSPAETDQ